MPDYTKPIINYTPPKSDSPETIAWLANWLNNRRELLYNNLGGIFSWSGYHPNTYNILQRQMARPGFNKRVYVNKNFYSQIENAASAKLYNHEINDWDKGFASGYYSLNDHTIHILPYLANRESHGNTILHEYTHAMGAEPLKYTIRKIMQTSKVNKDWNKDGLYSDSSINYLLNPSEIYSRMMEFRYENNIKPLQIIDLKFLDSHRESIKNNELDMFNDEDLIKLFNEVAYQPKETNNMV